MLRFFLGGQQSNEPSKKNPVHLRTQIGLLHVKYLFSFQIVCSYSPQYPSTTKLYSHSVRVPSCQAASRLVRTQKLNPPHPSHKPRRFQNQMSNVRCSTKAKS